MIINGLFIKPEQYAETTKELCSFRYMDHPRGVQKNVMENFKMGLFNNVGDLN